MYTDSIDYVNVYLQVYKPACCPGSDRFQQDMDLLSIVWGISNLTTKQVLLTTDPGPDSQSTYNTPQ